jgi:hypothetical protein
MGRMGTTIQLGYGHDQRERQQHDNGRVGTGTISIDGSGDNSIVIGYGTDNVTISGGDDNTVSAGTSTAGLTISGVSGTLSGSAPSPSAGGTLPLTGADSGAATIGSASTLELGVGALLTGDINFGSSPGGTLKIDGTAMPTNVINGFAQDDTIDLAGIPFGDETFAQITADNNLQIETNGPWYDLQLDPTDDFSGEVALASPDGRGGTDITLTPPIITLDYLEFSQLAYDYISSGGVVTVPTPAGWTELTNFTDSTGANAVVFKPINTDYHELVVSFQVSVSSYDWGVADPQGIVGGNTFYTPFNLAIADVTQLEINNPDDAIFVTGHSLGGAEAEAVAANQNLDISGGDTFAAPGVSDLLSSNEPAPNLTNVVISNDPVGAYTGSGSHVGDVNLLQPVTYFSNIFLTGVFGVVGLGFSMLTQHPL